MIKTRLTLLFAALFVLGLQAQAQYTSEIDGVETTFINIEESHTNAEWKSPVFDGYRFQFLTFDKIPSVDMHRQIKELGIILNDFRGNATYAAAVPASADLAALRSSTVTAIGRMDVAHKSSSDVYTQSLPEHSIEGNDGLLLVEYQPQVAREKVIASLRQFGAEVTQSSKYDNMLTLKVDLQKINSLASQPYIKYVEAIAPPPVADDNDGRGLHRVNRLASYPGGATKNYTGAGITVQVRDDGAVFDHVDFKGRMDQTRVGPTRGSHGDGVAGIMVGAGNLDVDGQGMAYGADFFVTDYSPNFNDGSLGLHLTEGVTVTNSSYSDGCNAGYTGGTRIVDKQTFENPTLLHVFSAGNDGQSDCGFGAGNVWGNITGGHKVGKNVIATANLNREGILVPSSSRGPVADGRIKPDIAAYGAGHISTDEEQGYMTFGGTSAAAPVVAGVAAVLQEAYKINHGEEIKSGLLKAIMLNTANDTENRGPDYKTGWGILNAHKAVRVIEEGRFMTRSITQDSTITIDFDVPINVRQMRIMTYWSDREGVTSTREHLINNINTNVSNGTDTYMPWILDATPDPIILDAPASRGVDNVNNMEQVAIVDPRVGVHTLTLDGVQIPFGEVEFYVVWEYDFDDIEVTYPNGNENLESSANATIYWDAFGDEGEFLIEVIGDDGSVIQTETADGESRRKPIVFSNQFQQSASVRVSRNGVVDQSDTTFIISTLPRNLRINEEGLMTWFEVPEAESYNIYLLGEKYMEIQDSSDLAEFQVPNLPEWRINWLAVSANFPDGREGKRSVAIPGRSAALALIGATDSVVCENTDVILSTDTPDEVGYSYEWVFGRNSSPPGAFSRGPHTIQYTQKGVKGIVLKVKNEVGETAIIRQIRVDEQPTLTDIEVDVQGGTTVSFSSDAEDMDSYFWDFGDGQFSADKRPTHEYADAGWYTVTLTGTSDGCGDISVNQNVGVGASNVDSPEADKFIITPNPSNGIFEVQLPTSKEGEATLKIIDLEGKVIATQSITANGSKQRLDYSHLATGVYLMQVVINQNLTTKRILIE